MAWDDPIELLVEMGETSGGGGAKLETASFLLCPLARPNVPKLTKWRYILEISKLCEYPCLLP